MDNAASSRLTVRHRLRLSSGGKKPWSFGRTGSKSRQRGLAVRTDSEDRQASSMTRIKSFLAFWGTFPGVLTAGVVALIGITVLIVVTS